MHGFWLMHSLQYVRITKKVSLSAERGRSSNLTQIKVHELWMGKRLLMTPGFLAHTQRLQIPSLEFWYLPRRQAFEVQVPD